MRKTAQKAKQAKRQKPDSLTPQKPRSYSGLSVNDPRPETQVMQHLSAKTSESNRHQQQALQLKRIFGDSAKEPGEFSVLQRAGDLAHYLAGTQIHWNSNKPASVGSHAYTQGKSVHIAPGQEKHVYHELGHVVQQSKGNVPVTTQVNGMGVNDNPVLERQADHIGSQIKTQFSVNKDTRFGAFGKKNVLQKTGYVDNQLLSFKLPPFYQPTPFSNSPVPYSNVLQCFNIGWVPNNPNHYRTTIAKNV